MSTETGQTTSAQLASAQCRRGWSRKHVALDECRDFKERVLRL